MPDDARADEVGAPSGTMPGFLPVLMRTNFSLGPEYRRFLVTADDSTVAVSRVHHTLGI